MPEYQLLAGGRVKDRFVSNIDPDDEDAVASLLRKQAKRFGVALSRAELRVKTKKNGWKNYRAT